MIAAIARAVWRYSCYRELLRLTGRHVAFSKRLAARLTKEETSRPGIWPSPRKIARSEVDYLG